MKLITINVTFTEREHKELQKKKGDKSWHDFILNNTSVEEHNKEEGSLGGGSS